MAKNLGVSIPTVFWRLVASGRDLALEAPPPRRQLPRPGNSLGSRWPRGAHRGNVLGRRYGLQQPPVGIYTVTVKILSRSRSQWKVGQSLG